MKLWSIPSLAALVLLAGCGLIYNYGDYHPTTGTGGAGTGGAGTGGGVTTGSSSGSSGGSASASTSSGTGVTASASASSSGGCPAPATCVPAPQGWSGPVALETGTTCPETGWPSVAISGGTSIAAWNCTPCICGGSVGTCPTPVELNAYGTLNCGGTLTSFDMTTCRDISAYDAVNGFPQAALAPSCAMPTPKPDPASPLTGDVTGCSGGVVGACAGGVCARPATRLCVYQMGVASCPSSYPNSGPAILDVAQDGRACTGCSCKLVSAPDCVPSVALFTSTDCSGAAVATVNYDASCTVFSNIMPKSAQLATVTQTPGVCSPTGGPAASGSVTTSVAITVCCST